MTTNNKEEDSNAAKDGDSWVTINRTTKASRIKTNIDIVSKDRTELENKASLISRIFYGSLRYYIYHIISYIFYIGL